MISLKNFIIGSSSIHCSLLSKHFLTESNGRAFFFLPLNEENECKCPCHLRPQRKYSCLTWAQVLCFAVVAMKVSTALRCMRVQKWEMEEWTGRDREGIWFLKCKNATKDFNHKHLLSTCYVTYWGFGRRTMNLCSKANVNLFFPRPISLLMWLS